MASKDSSEQTNLGKRVENLMRISELEISGFADFTGVSESHLYAVINGTKQLNKKTANKIAAQFNLSSRQLLNQKFKLTKKLKQAPALLKFNSENKGVHDYFIKTKIDRKVAYFIGQEILPKKKFDTQFSVSDVRNYCIEAGKNYTSKRVSQVLNYFVDRKKLGRKKITYVLKNGIKGKRMIDVFYKTADF